MAEWWKQLGEKRITELQGELEAPTGINMGFLGLDEILTRISAGEQTGFAPEMAAGAGVQSAMGSGQLEQAQAQLSQMPWSEITALQSSLTRQAQQTLSALTARRQEINVSAQQLYGMSIQQVESMVGPEQWEQVGAASEQDWSRRTTRGPRGDILLGVLGTEFQRMGGVIGSRAGKVSPYAPRTQQEMIAEFGGIKTGRVQVPSGWSQMSVLQAQLEITGTSQTEGLGPTMGQRGANLAGEMELLGNIPGYELFTDPGTGERMMDVPQFEKGVKRLWGAAKTGRVSATGLESFVSQVVGVSGGPPERVQSARTRLFFGPEMVSGAGAYGDVGRIQREMVRKFRVPKGAEVTVGAGDILSGGEPAKLFEGHTGIDIRQEGLQDIQVQHAFLRELEDKQYNELVFQGIGTLPEGVPVGSKFGGHKEGAYYDPGWTKAMGVQVTGRINEPYQAAAAFAMANVERDPGLVKQVFGEEFFESRDKQGNIKWQRGMGQKFVSWLQEEGRIQQGWLPQKGYNIQDPLVAQAVKQGTLRQATQPGEQGVFQGQEWNAWVDLDMATMLTGQPAYNPNKRMGPDAIANIASTDPQLARRLVEGTRRGPAVSMLGAGLANLPGEALTTPESQAIARRFREQSVVVGQPAEGETRPVADVEGIRAHAERALTEQGVTEQEGQIGEQMLRSFGEMYPGKGMYFAEQGLYAPGGKEALAYGFQNVEGELSQVPRGMHQLLLAEQERQAGVTRPGRTVDQPLSREDAMAMEWTDEEEGGYTPSLAAPQDPRAKMAGRLREQMLEVTSSKEFVTQLLGAESKGVGGGGWVSPVQAMPLNRFTGGHDVVRAMVGKQIKGKSSEADVDAITQSILSGKLDLRASIWRDPSLTKEQRRMAAGYMPVSEAIATGIVSSEREYEQRFGSTLGVAPAAMSVGAGDWDLDVMKRITRTTYERGGGGFKAVHTMAQSTAESIQSWIMKEPGGEHPGLMKDLEEYGRRTLDSVEGKLAKWAGGETISVEEMGQWTQAREGIRGLSMGGAYNLAQRQIGSELEGQDPALEAAQNLLATPYQLALDYKLQRVGPGSEDPDELDPVRGPIQDIQRLAGLKTTTFSWMEETEGEKTFPRLQRREREYVEQAAEGFASMRETSGKLGTAEARAALLIHPERAPEEFAQVKSILGELGEEPFGEDPSALQLRQRQQALGQISNIVMPEQTSTELRQPGRLSALMQRTTGVRAMLGGSYYGAIRKTQAANLKAGRPENYGFESTPGGGLRIPAYDESGKLTRTNEFTPEMVEAAKLGQRRHEYTGTQGRIQRQALRGPDEGGISQEEVLPRLVSAVSGITAAGEAPPVVARAWEQVMGQAAPGGVPAPREPVDISAAEILQGRRGGGPVPIPGLSTEEQVAAPIAQPGSGLVQEALAGVGGREAFGTGVQALREWRSQNVGIAPLGMRPTRQVLNRMYQQAGARGQPVTEAEMGEYKALLAGQGVGLRTGDEGQLVHEYGPRTAAPPAGGQPPGGPPSTLAAPQPYRPPSGQMPGGTPAAQGPQYGGTLQQQITQAEVSAQGAAAQLYTLKMQAGEDITKVSISAGEGGIRSYGVKPKAPMTAEQADINRRFLAGQQVFETQAASFQQMTTGQQFEALETLGISGGEAQKAAFNIAKGKAPTGPQWGALAESIGGAPARLEGMLQEAGVMGTGGQVSPEKFAAAVGKMTEALQENQPFLEKFGEVLKTQAQEYEAGERKADKPFGQFVGGMGRRAGQVLGAAEAAMAAGAELTPQQQQAMAQWQSISGAAGGAQGQMALQQMGQMAAGGGGPAGKTMFGRLKGAMFGWAPMQMGRAWNMLGAPVFNKMIPAAAQAEMQGWQLTQMAGGYQGQVLPSGIAGGLIQQQARQRQNLIEGGRAGYRAWGTGVPAQVSGGLQQAQGVLGPAAGLGLGAGILTNALGFGAAAGPVGLAVGGTLAAIGGMNYLSSFGEATTENQQVLLDAQRRGGAAEWWGETRAGLGRNLQTFGAAEAANWLGEQAPTQSTSRWVAEQAQAARTMRGTRMGDMSSADRMAMLNVWAQEAAPELGMDEGQFLQFSQQFAGYDFMQQDVSSLTANMPEQLRYAAATGTNPAQFRQAAGQLRMGAGGQRDYFDWMMGQRLDTAGQERATATTGQFAGLVGFGFDPSQILGGVASGQLTEATGYDAYRQQQLMGGDQRAWSQLGLRGGYVPGMEGMPGARVEAGTMGLVTQDPTTGMQVGQAAGGGALYQAQRGAFQNLGVQAQLGGRGGLDATTQLFGQQVGLSQWGIQDATTQAQRGEQQWQYQRQIQQMGMQGAQTRAQWGIQDQMQGLSRQHTRAGFGFQWEQLGMQDERFYENLGRRWGRTQVQGRWGSEDRERQYGRQMQGFQWQREDLTFGAEGASLQQAWGSEDIEEQLRYATGRQRRTLMKQRDRQNIQYARQMGQMETQEGRIDVREDWAKEDLERGRERHRLSMEWKREDIEQSRRYHEEDMDLAKRRLQENESYFENNAELQDKQKDLSRSYWEDMQDWQLESIKHQKTFREEMEAAQDAQLALSRAATQQMAGFFSELRRQFATMGGVKLGLSGPYDKAQ